MKNILKRKECLLIRSIAVIIFFAFAHTSAAQLCTGSLGDPIVNIDFGSGSGRGAALGSSVTAYTYSSSGDLGEGVYTIANTTSGLKGTAWHITTDHTGNTNGYMMAVNCATLASEGVFYTKSVTGLCANTTYEFSAWMMNVMNPGFGTDQYHPNVTFRVSTPGGTVLNSYNTGNIAQTSSPQWAQYGFYFTTGNDTEVVITILNSAPSGAPGNDLALDDIKFRPCGPAVTVSMDGGLTSKEICEGDPEVFTFTSTLSGGYSNPSYQWQVSTDGGVTWSDIAGATGTSYIRQPTDIGTYLYRLSVAQAGNISSASCRIASGYITVTVKANPDPDASSNSTACIGDTLRLSAANGGASYAWTGPDNFSSSSQNPVINTLTAVNNGTYYVTLTTSLGCTNIDSVKIDVRAVPSVDAGSDVAICEGSSTTLQGSGSGSYLWSPASGLSSTVISNPTANPTDSTTYILTVSDGQCKAYDTVHVFVWKKPIANAGPDKKIYEGNAVQLEGTATGTNVYYEWSPNYNINDISILNPVVTPTDDTTYTLKVISGYGCETATDKVFVRVYKTITVPNAFSPNNDGINDTWSIDKLNTYPEADISVFNRYGQLVFKSKGYAKQWDGKFNGKPLPVGTYYYVFDLKTGLGNPSGWVFILR